MSYEQGGLARLGSFAAFAIVRVLTWPLVLMPLPMALWIGRRLGDVVYVLLPSARRVIRDDPNEAEERADLGLRVAREIADDKAETDCLRAVSEARATAQPVRFAPVSQGVGLPLRSSSENVS